MKTTIIAVLFTIIGTTGFRGCSVKSSDDHNLFTLSDITYRSWVRSDTGNGTDITLSMVNVDPAIEFISITFRGIKIPLVTEKKGREVILKGRLVTGDSMIDNESYTVTGEENNLTYLYNSIEYRYPLKNIRRLPSEISGK